MVKAPKDKVGASPLKSLNSIVLLYGTNVYTHHPNIKKWERVLEYLTFLHTSKSMERGGNLGFS
jgi:hypothetical protein